MKYYLKISTIICSICFFLLGCSQIAMAQKEGDDKKIADKVSSKNFVFVANSVTPMSGRLRILTSPYDVRVNADSVISYLPYFGKSTQAPLSSEDAGIMFTSTSFDYSSEAGKKRSWEVRIKFKDQKNTSHFSFIIYDNGEASLNVTSTFRDPISYRGYIKM